jgi:hypothetical protein
MVYWNSATKVLPLCAQQTQHTQHKDMRSSLGLLPHFAFIFFIFTTVGCVRCVDTDDTDNNADVEWVKYEDFDAKDKILNLYATPFELFAVSRDEFLRIDANHGVIETRTLDADQILYGRPVLSDNTFMRLIKDSETGKQKIEFLVTKNSGQSYEIFLDDSLQTGETSYIDFDAWTPGAYSADGTMFLLPAIVFPSYKYAFFLFEITMNSNASEIVSIDLVRRYDVPNLNAEFGNISKTSWVNDKFYVNTKSGAWRINPEGQFINFISDGWKQDCFVKGDTTYLTDFLGTSFKTSIDNGVSWSPTTRPLSLNYVTIIDTMVLTQEFLGRPFFIANQDMTEAKPVVMDLALTQVADAFYGMVQFHGRVYITHQKKLFYTTKLR